MTAVSPAWRVAGASIAGPPQASGKDECQDSHRVEVTAHGLLIAVVSDGAGSAAHGGEGAALLCDHVVEGIGRQFALEGRPSCDRRGLRALCRSVQAAVAASRESAAALASERGVELSAFHATLVGAVMDPGRGGLFFHIGDGAALALADDRSAWLLSQPKNGEYSNTTYFFTQDDWRRHLRFKQVGPEFDTIFVMSDGVTELGLKHVPGGAEPFMPFFEPIGRFLQSASREEGEAALKATLDSAPVRARTADDKTLVWAQAR
jgi:hypothetical protein